MRRSLAAKTQEEAASEVAPQETKLQKAERIRQQSRKEAVRTKKSEISQALAEGHKLIKTDKFKDVFNKNPHKAGRVFKAGNSLS